METNMRNEDVASNEPPAAEVYNRPHHSMNEEKALRRDIRALREKIKSATDPYLSRELRELRARERAMRETAEATFGKRPRGRLPMTLEERAALLSELKISSDDNRTERQLVNAVYQSRYRKRKKAKIEELLRTIDTLSGMLEDEPLSMRSAN
jgi:2-methylcitrate dehydratase PrpD